MQRGRDEDVVTRLNQTRAQLLTRDGESLLQMCENRSAYLEIFSRQPVEANLIAQALDQNRAQVKFDKWVVTELERVAVKNEAMVRCNYLQPAIVEQAPDKPLENPAYKAFATEQEYIDAYNKRIDTVTFDFFGGEKNVRDLDRLVNNTAEYVKECSQFDLFIDLLKKQPLISANHQAYVDKFIKPIEDIIKRYHAAQTMEDKIAYYKQISSPLRNLSTEMYYRAAAVYPACYQPTWLRPVVLEQFRPQ